MNKAHSRVLACVTLRTVPAVISPHRDEETWQLRVSAIENLSGEPDLALGSPLPLRETPLTPAGAGSCPLGREEGRST